jgi:hypothetical protein
MSRYLFTVNHGSFTHHGLTTRNLWSPRLALYGGKMTLTDAQRCFLNLTPGRPAHGAWTRRCAALCAGPKVSSFRLARRNAAKGNAGAPAKRCHELHRASVITTIPLP